MAHRTTLPKASGEVELILLDGGGFTTTEDWRLHADARHETYYLYDWAFYIHHKSTGRRILWDLGISNDRSLYTPCVLEFQWTSCNPIGPRYSLVDQLEAVGVEAEDIDTIIFSHAHWDHCRPVKQEFPKAQVLFGPGTVSHCRPGHIQRGKVEPTVQWDARFFSDDETVRQEASEELDGPWQPWGPFEKAMDYFRDGSFWIIQAPGHMPGNLAACVRLPSGELVLLGSDCCHSRDIFDGKRAMANVSMPDGSRFCLHQDFDAASDTIERLREAVRMYGMHFAMAHDAEFIRKGKDTVLLSILHPRLTEKDCMSRISAGQPA